MKKIISILLSAVLIASLGGCKAAETGGATETTEYIEETTEHIEKTTAVPVETTKEETVEPPSTEVETGIPKEDLKIGFLYIGDESQSYTAAHAAGAMEMKEALGLSDEQLIIKWSVPEDEAAYEAAVDLAEQGCQLVFGNSFGFEPYMLQAAAKYPQVQFCHASGNQADALPNMNNYFVSIHEARYVSGVVAGMKLNEMIEEGVITKEKAKIGYVGTFPYAEVISGYTAFFLGARSVCPSVVMDVTYTNSWSNYELEKEAAEALIDYECVLIGYHGDTTGTAVACEQAGVPVVGYHTSVISAAPNQALTSAAMNWGSYVTYAVQSVTCGTSIEKDWCGGYSDGANGITELNAAAVAKGTREKVNEVEEAILAGTLQVFDTKTWTVGGKTLDSYQKKGIEYISEGYFHEAEYGSSPAFDLIIDGITDLTK